MNMPSSEAQRKWMEKNTIVFSIKLMRRTEADLIEFFDAMQARGIPKGTIIKKALREYMENHKEET